MKRPAPTPNWRADRAKWTDLVARARAAVATEPLLPPEALADRARAADSCWIAPGPLPGGLCGAMLARTAFVYARQVDGAVRAALAPGLSVAADWVEAVLAEQAAAETMPPADAEMPAVIIGRLPYVE